METPDVKVADVMRTSLHIVDGLSSVQSAIAEMNRHGISSLVIDRRHEGDEYGFVTVHDIAANVIAMNRSTERTSVYEIMTKPALTINAEMNVKYAIRLLAQLGLSRALVASGKGLQGLVSLRDLVLSYTELGDAAP
jgi:signal-transduction protein with cAMP-binding, CBS, and nucleotidyltransferase domain